MTDPIDDLLTDAGRQWRNAQPDPPEPDTTRWIQHNRRWLPVLAAAAATLIAGGAAVVLADRPSDDAGPAAAEALVVHDGDTVEASGTVLSLPGEPVRFCAPAPVALGGGGGPEADCPFYVPVTGVDPAEGEFHLVGVWHAGTLTVTEQGPPSPATPAPTMPDEPPCPAPAGGWKTDAGDRTELYKYLDEQHPDQFRPVWVAHPGGVEVLVIEVVKGDAAQARGELAKRYTGNLCVVATPGRPSIADQRKLTETVGDAVGDLMDDHANGIYATATGDTVRPELVILTPQLYATFADIGFTSLVPDPWLRPVKKSP
ncbi:hypothetical protein GCM10010435_24290 [Winogradskya consettensis]|uniref:Uncharacterized protein n=1 Tax=Winogradskya consettensis TaxID=113560 RepID=A0A919T0I4_9ACTN|nr:hypothetical protein [Actinoplanes consettensis]GIM82464.1 hypothetical protein Aco04nite_81610 [Actinoplanes consettensis]